MADHFTEDDITHIFQVFSQYDKGRKGRLPLKDLPHAMLSLGHNPTVDELNQLVQSIEKEDDRNYLEFPEFLRVLAYHLQELEPEDRLREAFKVFDKDDHGKLNAKELRSAMLNLGERLSKDEVDYMVKMSDLSGDGRVNYEEFIRVMTTFK